MKTTGMVKIRVRALKHNPNVIRCVKPKRRSRIDSAVNGKYAMRAPIPENVRELIIEKKCLKLELKILAARFEGKSHPTASIEMAEKIKRIENLTNKIMTLWNP